MHKTTAVIDSPEALGLALCRHVPDMANGFTITTRDSQLQLTVTAEDTRPFMGGNGTSAEGQNPPDPTRASGTFWMKDGLRLKRTTGSLPSRSKATART